ncbi:MAG: helix-turn-helix domain-containing protein [Solirubrobacteraceae bacterium]
MGTPTPEPVPRCAHRRESDHQRGPGRPNLGAGRLRDEGCSFARGERMSTNGLLIRRLRQDAGWSVRELGTSAEVSPGYLSRVERGRADASPFWVAAVAGAFHVPPSPCCCPIRTSSRWSRRECSVR